MEVDKFPVWKKWDGFYSEDELTKLYVLFDGMNSGKQWLVEEQKFDDRIDIWVDVNSCFWKDCKDPTKVDIKEIYDHEVLESYKKNGTFAHAIKEERETDHRGDGGTTSYYQLPENAKELGDLIYHKEMNHSIGEAFCALYRLNDNGEYKRNLRKAKYYIDLELSRVDG